MSKVLIQVQNLEKHFKVKDGTLGHKFLKAVDKVSFDILEGETLGLVGESGCGKSTLGRSILNLHPSTSGEVLYRGEGLFELSHTQMKAQRKKMQIIFQDPSASLNPRKTIESIILEPMIVHKMYDHEKRVQRVTQLLMDVGLPDYHRSRYPHELSGGQKQRVGIARALSLDPEFIVCDEAVSALDVSVQAQVINLLQSLQKKYNLTYLFISHNMNVVYQVSDRVIVMYLGKILEAASYAQLYENPGHPYTKALLSAIPQVHAHKKGPRIELKGDIPNPADAPKGCKFCTRCPEVFDKCREIEPEMSELEENHFAACHLLVHQ
ncbi:ABC transporter ATP-binding protein [Oceanispirochaeta sp.]|uniref:ABC transporter ATP-binding protein n=1 Tax=Oceanispirochaeta sp. TaxID=2035350 RepID=UPI00263283A5|nr:ABC transporter ATP-binding protein [Oceanispirochaeta sp.]MDA3957284.1 ABC transporter ATP-binding protein [Oceanispirochaeta sp.]